MTRTTHVAVVHNHDEAYSIWSRLGVRNRPLVHVDAHDDLLWLDRIGQLSIANYVCQALKDGIVSAVWWVVPDPIMHDRARRRRVASALNELRGRYPDAGGHATASTLAIRLLGRDVTACSLAELPRAPEPALVDIDTDFLILPGQDRPWIRPRELVFHLRQRVHDADAWTVAYSVEGGFTPLEWRHLGDEVGLEIANAPAQSGRADALAAITDGAIAETDGDLRTAERIYMRAATLLPDVAAPQFRLARLLAASGRIDEARARYRRAVAIDPTYRTRFASRGFVDVAARRLDAAYSAFESALVLDPEDADALVGMAIVQNRRGQWAAAEDRVRQALAVTPTHLDAHRLLGRVCERTRRFEEAAHAYRTSLNLALKGASPYEQPIATPRPDREYPADVAHARTYCRLARVEAKTGRRDAAVAAYRIGLALRPSDAISQLRVALLFARAGHWRMALAHASHAVSAVPASVRGMAGTWELRWRHRIGAVAPGGM